MDVNTDSATSESNFLDTVEGEISFFRSVMRTRPVGIHRYFHVLAIRNAIHRDTGHWVSMEDVWGKLRTCYDLDVLENIEAEGYDTPNNSPSGPYRSPSPTENLSIHPHFRQEFTLPHDAFVESLVSRRRMRATASLPSSSPAPSPSVQEKPVKGRNKKAKTSKYNMAGLVAGDSDSSALTQESGDESISPTPRLGSVATGTDAGTEYADDGENGSHSPGPSSTTKTRGKSSKSLSSKKGGSTRARATSGSSKKRKR